MSDSDVSLKVAPSFWTPCFHSPALEFILAATSPPHGLSSYWVLLVLRWAFSGSLPARLEMIISPKCVAHFEAPTQ